MTSFPRIHTHNIRTVTKVSCVGQINAYHLSAVQTAINHILYVYTLQYIFLIVKICPASDANYTFLCWVQKYMTYRISVISQFSNILLNLGPDLELPNQ